jgi:hypothetical protein
MTDCIAQLAFSFHKKRQVVADFSGGHLTSDAGLLPLRELDHRLGWTATAAKLLSDSRDPAKVTHETAVLLRQRLFALIAGYEDANDHTRLRTDPALKLLCGRELGDEHLASQPTLSRFENSITARQVARLNRLLLQQYIQLHRKQPPQEIILDVDPTDDPCHGHQQLALFNGYYDQYMYLPLLVFERRSGMLLGVRLRAGTAPPAKRVLPLLRPLVEKLQHAFPHSRLILRADAGFATPQLYDFCEERGLGYLIGFPANSVLQEETDWALPWLQQRFAQDQLPHRWIGGFRYQAGSWGQERRILYKVEVNREGTNRRFLVTNLKGLPRDLFPLYNDRGTAEGFIDQLKNQLFSGRLSCSRFVANAFRLLLSALAYNLVAAYRQLLAGTELESASVETIRTRLLKIGARLRQTARRFWVYLASGFPLRELLVKLVRRIAGFHPPPLAA